MDNYNGKKTMGEYQNLQQPTQKVQYQQPMQGEFQQLVYQNGYSTQPNFGKPKSGGRKWLLIIGIPVVLSIIAAAVIVIICLLIPSYNVDDYDAVYDACYDVFDMKLKKREDISYISYRGIVDCAKGEKEGSKCYVGTVWYEFESEELAEEYYEEYVEDLKWDIYDGDDYSWKTDDRLTKGFVGTDGVIVIKEDEYVVLVKLEGKRGIIEMLAEEFIAELD